MENQLRSTLKGNALFSLGSGLSLILFSDQIMAFLAITSTFPLKLIGFGLLFFVLFLTYVAYKNKLNKSLVYTIIAQDIAWVITSIIILIFDAFAISFPGKSVMFLIAMIVSVFALRQYTLYRRL